jgi:small basic protein
MHIVISLLIGLIVGFVLGVLFSASVRDEIQQLRLAVIGLEDRLIKHLKLEFDAVRAKLH